MDGLNNCLPRNKKEKQLAAKLGYPESIRLACQTKISGDITIRRPVVEELDLEIISKQLEDVSGTKLGKEKDLAILSLTLRTTLSLPKLCHRMMSYTF